MALVVADRVQETSTTSGTGTLTLAGAIAGYQSFSTAIGNGNTTFYTIYDSTTYDWEVGIGTVGAGTLARTTVLSNSAGTTSPISFAGNSKFVFCTYPAEKSINYDANGVATIGDVLGYSDTGIVGSFASTVAGYNQVIVQNKSTATNASSNLNVSNDAGTAGSNYAELGINSSTFTGSGSFNIAGASYVASASTDLTLGTYGAYNVHFVTNSNTTDAMTIFNDGGISLGGFANPGIANMAASKFVPGYTAVTSAAGTTVLTEDSNYYQNLLGSTTQTFQLPDATTLLVGTTFIFDNDSSGTLTVVDNASGPIETIPGGAAGFVYLAVNSTVAGTWRRHAFLPASYDFNNTTANFGTATITNASWNGNTIGTAYGGTGLTSFSAANYALYSTSSSALTAGTLPVAAGGSGAVTFTANGVLYGDGTNPLGVTAAGTTGQVLIGNTGAAPSWGTVSSSLVSSFQTSLSGLTPSTATTGAVTLAGTLGPTSGGTGLTSYTTGDIIYASATNTLSALADVATGNALISGGVSTAPSWGKIGLTTHVSGTLPTANGGTDLTSFTSGGALYATSTSALTTGTLPAASGGTSFSTYTTGDLIYASATNTLSRLSVGTSNKVLTVISGTPSWEDTQSTMVYPGVGIPNSTGSAWGTSYSTTGSGTVVALATSPSFTTPVLGTPTSGNFSTGTFTWPTFNQNTTGSAATLTTPRSIYGNNFDGSADLTQVIASTYGGTGNGFTKFTGPATAEKTFTLPNASATILTSNDAVTIGQGGTGQTTAAAAFDALNPMTTLGDIIYEGTGPTAARLGIGSSGQVLTVSGGIPSWQTPASGGVTSITGTANQVIASASTGAVTLSTPQDIGTASSVQFGSFGVGTAASGTTGEIRATNNVTAYYSDARLKDFKGTIPNALAKVLLLNGYYFTENEKAKELGYNNDKVQVGVSAQEVEAVMPEVVTDAPINVNFEGADYKTVYYDKLVPLLIEAIKELKAEVDELKKGK